MNDHALAMYAPQFSRRLSAALLVFLAAGSLVAEEEKPGDPPGTRHQITGLFAPERVEDLQTVVEQIPGVTATSVDFATAEAVLDYDAGQLFPGASEEQIIQRLDNLLRQASRHTFGVKPLCAVPRDKLERVEIPVVGLDCPGCSLAAYEAVYRLEGVEQAIASFKIGLVTAWIDPGQTDRRALEDALVQRRVRLREPAGE
jgi:copper chaperone CopZ